MVKIMENPIEMDEKRRYIPLFSETPNSETSMPFPRRVFRSSQKNIYAAKGCSGQIGSEGRWIAELPSHLGREFQVGSDQIVEGKPST